MEKEQIILFSIIGFTIVIFGIIFVAAKPNFQASPQDHNQAAVNSGNQPGGGLSAQETLFDFGTISMEAGKVGHTFKVRNESPSPIVITRLYTSCMCTTAIFNNAGRKFGPFGMQGHGYIPAINQTLAPGEGAEVEVIFDPAAHGPAGVGTTERVVYIENTASAQPLQLGITATVTP